MTDLSALSSVTVEDLRRRTGYPASFLGVDVPMPGLTSGEPAVALAYTHYSLRFRPDRRFAAVTAMAMDGARLFDLPREGIAWEFDPRLPREQQAGPEIYRDNDLDKGHLVRRASACWGATRAEAEQANVETFFYTNATPQAAQFNQGKLLWLGLEDYLQDHAATYDRKLAVFAGPVLEPSDPPYRGIRIPLRFWKVAGFVQDGALAATGYLLDQTPLVHDRDAAFAAAAAAGSPPPLGDYRMFQVPIADLATLTGVDLDQLAAVDRLKRAPAEVPVAPGEVAGSWVQLGSFADITV